MECANRAGSNGAYFQWLYRVIGSGGHSLSLPDIRYYECTRNLQSSRSSTPAFAAEFYTGSIDVAQCLLPICVQNRVQGCRHIPLGSGRSPKTVCATEL